MAEKPVVAGFVKAVGIYSDDFDSDSPGLSDEHEQLALDPVGDRFQRARFGWLEKTGSDFVDPSWFELVGRVAEKPGTPVTFSKGTMGHKLGIVSQETVITETGEKWIHSFNAAGEMVDAREIDSCM